MVLIAPMAEARLFLKAMGLFMHLVASMFLIQLVQKRAIN